MAINKKLIHFKRKETFEKELSRGNILDTSIVFIKDSQEIYTHGQFYGVDEIKWFEEPIKYTIFYLTNGKNSVCYDSHHYPVPFKIKFCDFNGNPVKVSTNSGEGYELEGVEIALFDNNNIGPTRLYMFEFTTSMVNLKFIPVDVYDNQLIAVENGAVYGCKYPDYIVTDDTFTYNGDYINVNDILVNIGEFDY